MSCLCWRIDLGLSRVKSMRSSARHLTSPPSMLLSLPLLAGFLFCLSTTKTRRGSAEYVCPSSFDVGPN
ncbi:unnamed protein product [Prunus armeniaca]